MAKVMLFYEMFDNALFSYFLLQFFPTLRRVRKILSYCLFLHFKINKPKE